MSKVICGPCPSAQIKLSRFKGCLLGGAIGDAMGMPGETYSRQQILKKYGEIKDLLPKDKRGASKPAGSWTDDTYMTMLTAKSIINCEGINIGQMTETYLDTIRYNFGVGGTTRQALELRMSGQDISSLAKGRHAGAGAASRIAPVALLEHDNLEKLCLAAEQVSQITHLDRDAVDSAVVVAFTIAWIIRGERDIYSILEKNLALAEKRQSNIYYGLKNVSEILTATKLGHRPPATGDKAQEGIEIIGTDGLALRLVPSALYAFMAFPDNFTESVLAAVNAGGDTDTRAAITGAISGAYNGFEGIPPRWVRKLQDKNVILTYAERLWGMTNKEQV